MGIIKRVDHVAIGVKDMQKAQKLFLEDLGGETHLDAGTVPSEGFRWQQFMLGGKKLELVSPLKPGEGGVGRYIATHGEGLHHLSVTVENVPQAVKFFKSKGIGVLGASLDFSQWRHFYLHPKDTFGALIQVIED